MRKDPWACEASQILKAMKVRSGVTNARLADLLADVGVEETEASIKQKLNRGTFSFIFVLQVMKALDKDRLEVG